MLTIGKLAAVISNISSDALRYYEREDPWLLLPELKLNNGFIEMMPYNVST